VSGSRPSHGALGGAYAVAARLGLHLPSQDGKRVLEP
jgi:hypothetical protein